MSYPQPMANWDAMVLRAAQIKAREARIQAVRESYPVPDFLRGEQSEQRQAARQGELFGHQADRR